MKAATLAMLLVVSGCGGTWYTKYANHVSAYASAADAARLLPTTDITSQAPPANLKVVEVPEGHYLVFVIDRVCVNEIPGLLGNLRADWLGLTLLTRLTGPPTLFTEFENAVGVGSRLARERLLQETYVTPTQRILTNSGHCVTDGYRSLAMPLEGYGVNSPPRMLVVIDVLTSKRRKDYLSRVDAVQQAVAGFAQVLNRGTAAVGEYSALAGKIIAQGNLFLDALLPDRHILWTEREARIWRKSTGVYLVPAPDQHFFDLFTEPQAVVVDGNPGSIKACPVHQADLEQRLRGRQVGFERDLSVADPQGNCPGGRFSSPYLVWHVETQPYARVPDKYWDRVGQILTQLKQERANYDYAAALQFLKDETAKLEKEQETAARLISTAQVARFSDLVNQIDRLSQALGLRDGGARKCPDAVAAINYLVGLTPDRQLGATDAIAALLAELQSGLRQACIAGPVRQLRQRVERAVASREALADDLVAATLELQRDFLCDVFLHVAARALDVGLTPEQRCLGSWDGTACAAPADSAARDSGWIQVQKAYFELLRKPSITVLTRVLEPVLGMFRERGWAAATPEPAVLLSSALPRAVGQPIDRIARQPLYALDIVDWLLDRGVLEMAAYTRVTGLAPVAAARWSAAGCPADLGQAFDQVTVTAELGGRLAALRDQVGKMCLRGFAPADDVAARAETGRYLASVIDRGARSAATAGMFRCVSRALVGKQAADNTVSFLVVNRLEPPDSYLLFADGQPARWGDALPDNLRPVALREARRAATAYLYGDSSPEQVRLALDQLDAAASQ